MKPQSPYSLISSFGYSTLFVKGITLKISIFYPHFDGIQVDWVHLMITEMNNL